MNNSLRTKLVPGTNCLVDCFKSKEFLLGELENKPQWTETGFVRFLTHYHGDHYSGLSKDWHDEVVHCSVITGKLLKDVMQVPEHLVCPYELAQSIEFDGFRVVMVDANHCPGAVLLLIERSDGTLFLHCGDMRYSPAMKENPALVNVRHRIDTIFLDTTYAHPNHVFPTQQETIQRAVSGLQAFLERDPKERCLVLVSAYTIGKERVVVGVCNAMGYKSIYLEERKRKVFKCLDMPPEHHELFFSGNPASPVHICPMGTVGSIWPYFQPNFGNITKYLDKLRTEHGVSFERVFALIPTGWADASNYNKRNAVRFDPTGTLCVTLVPYSEHSNFSELVEFVSFLKPRRVVPTVYSDEKDYRRIVHLFRNHVDHQKSKEAFLQSFQTTVTKRDIVDVEAQEHVVEDGNDTMKDSSTQNDESQANAPRLNETIDTSADSSPKTWACTFCTFLNNADKYKDRCEICDNQRRSSPLSSSSVPSSSKRTRAVVSSSPSKPASGRSSQKKQKTTLFSFFKKPDESTEHTLSQPQLVSNVDPPKDPAPQPFNTSTALESSLQRDHQASNTSKAHKSTLQRESRGPNISTMYQHAQESLESEEAQRDISMAHEQRGESTLQLQLEEESNTPKPHGHSQGSTPQRESVEASEVDLTVTIESFQPPENKDRSADIHFALLANALSKVVSTTKRLEKHKVLVNMFRCAIAWTEKDAETIHKLVFLTIGKFANDHETLELSIGGSMISKAIVEATGAQKKQLSKLYKEYGDIGDVAFECKRSQRILFATKVTPLSIHEVFDTIHKLAKERGQGSEQRRKNHILKLMRKAQGEEIRFLVRLLIGNTRIGANEVSVLDALVEASLRHEHSFLEKAVISDAFVTARLAFNRRPDMIAFVSSLLSVGVQGILEACQMTPGIPVRPMLAQVCQSVEEFISAFGGKGGFTCEFKYDGQRVQIHRRRKDASYEIFSRQCQSNTAKFPDAIKIVEDCKMQHVHSFILDAEVVAVDRTNGNKILPFQTLSTRSRKGEPMNGTSSSPSVDVALFAFDLIQLNDESLVDKPLRKRRELIKQSFVSTPGFFVQVESMDFDDAEQETKRDDQIREMMKFMQKALDCSCEGLVAKLLDTDEAVYEPNKRSSVWLKLKQDYVENAQGDADQESGLVIPKLLGGGLGDTLDLVPIGAWHGSGRKSKWWSPFLLACYDPETETFQTLCKVMSGFSDEFYEQQNQFYASEDEHGESRTLASKPQDYMSDLSPSVWFKPCQVWEIRGAELTLSPVHKAAHGLLSGSHQGLSLRFPRFLRLRPDKSPPEATSSYHLQHLYLTQTRR